jgi:hypothetical protein
VLDNDKNRSNNKISLKHENIEIRHKKDLNDIVENIFCNEQLELRRK